MKISKDEKKLLKIFYNCEYPQYVRDLNIIYEMDFFTWGVKDAIKGKKRIVPVSDFYPHFKNQLIEHVMKTGTFEDKKYYYLSEVALNILFKYYDSSGNMKQK